MSSNIQITLKKSLIGKPKKHRSIIVGLGLKKLNSNVLLVNSPEVLGMIAKVSHMLKVEAK